MAISSKKTEAAVTNKIYKVNGSLLIETPFYLIWRAKYLKNIEYVLIFSVLFNILLLFIIYLQRNRLLRFMPKYNVDKYPLTTRHRDIKKVLSCGRKLIKSVDNLDGIQFERLCCEILHKQGYIDIYTTRTTGDFGIDILCKKNGTKFGIQCKCYSSHIGIDAIQQAFSGCAYYKCDIPVVMTNEYFTDAAQELAEKLGVVLWSRYHLMEVLEEIKRKI